MSNTIRVRQEFQRAPGTPPLPATPVRFIWHFIAHYPFRYAAMVLFEGSNAACGILIPYALGKIIKGVTASHGNAASVVAALHRPLCWFVGLGLAEVVLGRLAGAVQIRLGPRQRQNVTRQIHQYLQNHCHHYFSNNFAGALAHRISETSMGVTQTLWSIITEFWPIAIIISVSVGLLFNAHAELGCFALAWAVLFVGISFVLARRCQPHAFTAFAARSETTGTICRFGE